MTGKIFWCATCGKSQTDRFGKVCAARFPDGRWVRYCLGCSPVGPHRKAGYRQGGDEHE